MAEWRRNATRRRACIRQCQTAYSDNHPLRHPARRFIALFAACGKHNHRHRAPLGRSRINSIPSPSGRPRSRIINLAYGLPLPASRVAAFRPQSAHTVALQRRAQKATNSLFISTIRTFVTYPHEILQVQGLFLGKCNTKTGTAFRSVECGNGPPCTSTIARQIANPSPTPGTPTLYSREQTYQISSAPGLVKTGAVIPDIQL